MEKTLDKELPESKTKQITDVLTPEIRTAAEKQHIETSCFALENESNPETKDFQN